MNHERAVRPRDNSRFFHRLGTDGAPFPQPPSSTLSFIRVYNPPIDFFALSLAKMITWCKIAGRVSGDIPLTIWYPSSDFVRPL